MKKPEDQKTRMEKESRRELANKKLNENQPKEKAQAAGMCLWVAHLQTQPNTNHKIKKQTLNWV